MFPVDFYLENPAIGKALLSTHTWRRFWGRYRLNLPKEIRWKIISETNMIEELKGVFARAYEVQLVETFAIERAWHNECNVAHYFYDQLTNLRFVIIDAGTPHAKIVTVEWVVNESDMHPLSLEA